MSIKRPAARVTWRDHDDRIHMDVITFGVQEDGTIVGDLDEAVEFVRNREPGLVFDFDGQAHWTFDQPVTESWRQRLVRQLQEA